MEATKEFEQNDYWSAIYGIRSKMSVEGMFEGIDTLADTFAAFIEYGNDFYDKHIAFEQESDEDKDNDELIDLLVDSYVKKLYFLVPAFILFVRKQEKEYVEYLKEVRISDLLSHLTDLTNIDKKTLHTIYEFESSDMINDLYLTLRYVQFVLENFDNLIQTASNPVDLLRDNEAYSHVSIAQQFEGVKLVPMVEFKDEILSLRKHFEDIILALKSETLQSSDKIKWLGTSTELAYLFEQLAYRGYIDNTQTKDGDMNKTALARAVWQHIAPENIKEDTFIVDLRGSRLSENSTFAKAMNSIPSNSKIK